MCEPERLDTGLVERRLDDVAEAQIPGAVLASVALAPLVAAAASPDPWHHLVAWRHHRRAAVRHEFDVAGRGRHVVWTTPHVDDGSWDVAIEGGVADDADHIAFVASFTVEPDGRWRAVLDGRAFHLTAVVRGRTTHAALEGVSWAVTRVEQRGAGDDTAGPHGDGTVRSPMPGTVISVAVADGDAVTAGQTVAIVEAMKMEHSLVAPFDGFVVQVLVASGGSVGLDEAIITISPDP